MNSIKKAFDCVRAEEKLKNNTKAFIAEKIDGNEKETSKKHSYAIAAAVCVFLFVIGGNLICFIPTAGISIDVNPSVELNVNMFDRVVSVTACNDDGELLAERIDVRFKNYSDAVEQITADESVSALLSDGGVMSVAVTGSSEEQSSRILSGVKKCTARQKNTYCYSGSRDEVKKARDLGLSYGKYKAYTELLSLGVEISPEDIKNMSMREIRDLAENDASDNSGGDNASNSEKNTEQHQNAAGKAFKRGKRKHSAN